MVMSMEKENLSAGSPPSPKTTSSPEKRTRPMPEDGNQGEIYCSSWLGIAACMQLTYTRHLNVMNRVGTTADPTVSARNRMV